MPILKSLSFTALPKAGNNPVQTRRTKFITKLEEQKLLLVAFDNEHPLVAPDRLQFRSNFSLRADYARNCGRLRTDLLANMRSLRANYARTYTTSDRYTRKCLLSFRPCAW